jgi:hypothetical protein
MSLTHVKELEAFARQTMSAGGVQQTIEYLLDSSAATYNDMSNALFAVRNNFLASLPAGAGVSSPRILVTLADGTTIFDSSRGANPNSANTPANAAAKAINENHMSRLAIAAAMLGQSGVGMEKKYSTSTQKFEQYLAHRLGRSQQDAIGCIRWSLEA